MKPIRLTIRGINSYREEQEIDFSLLTGRGLFGVFGPTGSGKSTILDAMTLALYAKLPRSSKNFVNLHEKSGYVSYIFSIRTDAVRTYQAERTFRCHAGNAGQTVRNVSGRLLDLSGEEPVVLADRPTEVTQACIRLLGLTAEDFMRTVVLPQGQFSEFLRLKNADRRSMLQRIFHLEPYGAALTGKIARARNAQDLLLSRLEGQLAAYGDLSAAQLSAMEKEREEGAKRQEALKTAEEEARQDFAQADELWNLLCEYRPLKERLARCLAKEEEMQRRKERLALAKKAGSLLPLERQAKAAANALKQAEADRARAQKAYETCQKDEAAAGEKREAEEKSCAGALPALYREEQLLSLSASLWKNLKEGQPCPVCGSIYHESDHKDNHKKAPAIAGQDGKRLCEAEYAALLKENLKKQEALRHTQALLTKERQEASLLLQKKREASLAAAQKETAARARQEELSSLLAAQKNAFGFSPETDLSALGMTQAAITRAEKQLADYAEILQQTRERLRYLEEKRDGRDIAEEEWQAKRNRLQKAAAAREAQDQALSLLTHNLARLRESLAKKEELTRQQAKAAHRREVIRRLETLFKGNAFVEYVAQTRLSYIAAEASSILFSISGGSYTLEVGEETEFIIRDHKNGGNVRPCDTLSGGETFLASLSLALALSSTLQLNQTAPLELFFLDEGFGSLDDNLLDIVMTSLERLASRERSIGVISHVEAIRTRVPVGLIVTPSEGGAQGSRVAVEYT